MAIDLCTLADVRGELETEYEDVERDKLIAELIEPASQAVITEVNRELGPPVSDVTRRFRVKPKRLVDGAVFVSLAVPLTNQSEGRACDLFAPATVTLHPESSSPYVLDEGVGGYVLDVDRYGMTKALRLSRRLSFSSDVHGEFGFCYLDITGDWGFPSVPVEAKQATILAVMSWSRRDVSTFAEAPSDPAAMKPQAPASYALPLASKQQLSPLYRQRVF